MTALLLAAPFAADAAPYVGYAYPAGVQVGRQARIVVGGQGIRGVKGAWVSGEGVTVTKISQVPNFPYFVTYGYREWTRAWIDAVARARHEGRSDVRSVKPPLPKDGNVRFWPKCSWWERIDSLDELEFALTARDSHTTRDPLQEIAALAQQLILDVQVDANAEPGTRDLILYDASGASAPHPFFVTGEPHAAEPLFVPPELQIEDVRVQTLPVVLDGRILPREKDAFSLHLTAGTRLVCRLVGRELEPYIGDAVPGFFNPVMRLCDAKGDELVVADDYHYLPDPVLVYDVPQDGTYVLEIRDNLFRGRPDFVYSVFCTVEKEKSPPPEVVERAFVCAVPPASVEGPLDCLVCPGAAAVHKIVVDKPGDWSFELLARRIGSPLDGVLRLCDETGKTLSVWDDVVGEVYVGSVPQGECDPTGTWSFAAPGTYTLRVTDRVGKGGRDYRYALLASPAKPDFSIYSEKSTFLIGWGGRAKASFKVRVVRRNGFKGAVALDETDDFSFEQSTVPGDESVATVVAVSRKSDWTGVREVSFSASAVGTDGPKGVRVLPADAVEQAFAYSHLLPARAFRFLRPRQEQRKLKLPEWIYMPTDQFAPDLLTYSTAELASKPSAEAIDALVGVESPIVPVPKDVDDGLILAKFASSAAHVIPTRRGRPVSYDRPGTSLSGDACAWALLAGASRIVETSLKYADGDEVRVRTLARAVALPRDNDALLWVPEGSVSIAGEFGTAARALRDGGYCVDYVTSAMLTNALMSARYRTLFVPRLTRKMRQPLFEILVKKVHAGWTVLFEGALPGEGTSLRRELLAKMKDGSAKLGKGQLVVGDMRRLLEAEVPARRERFTGLNKLRFARFSSREGGWYFICNPTRGNVRIKGRFATLGKTLSAAVMWVSSAKVEELPLAQDGSVDFTLDAGEIVWVFVSPWQFSK